MTKIKLSSLISLILVVNILGFLAKHLGYNAYLIFLGYRFHISFVLPFLFFAFNAKPTFYKKYLKKNPFEKFDILLFVILIPLAVTFIIYFLLEKKIDFHPEYFYEFGISSIFDYPIYLIWNLPQLLLSGLFISLLHESGFKSFAMMLILPSLFIFELFYIKNLLDIVSLVVCLLAVSILLVGIFNLSKNVYSISFFCFSILWASVLLFGSNSQSVINNLFASTYDSWQGFFSSNSIIEKFVISFNLILSTVTFYMIRGKVKA